MKRRIFLSSAATVGIVGAASGGAPIISSAYTSISKNVSLAEFSPVTKNVLNKFKTELSENFKELDQRKKLINRIAMPIRVIKTDFKGKNHSIVYKNEAGDYVTLAMENGVESVYISNKL